MLFFRGTLKRSIVTGLMTLAFILNARAESGLAVKNLRCEYKTDPIGIDVTMPRLSWQLVSAERGVTQKNYEVRVALSEAGLAKGKLVWDSGVQPSDASIQVEYVRQSIRAEYVRKSRFSLGNRGKQDDAES